MAFVIKQDAAILCGMARPKQEIKLTEEELNSLKKIIAAVTSTQRETFRAKIILLANKGFDNIETARQLRTSHVTVGLWRSRFCCEGIKGLEDAPGRGRKSFLPLDKVSKVVEEVVKPPKGHTRWSCRTMSQHAGVSKSQVQKIWQANDLKPHQVKIFKLSNDKNFEEKFWDVIGIYLNPPDKAVVLCCDEKSQCQALERTRKSLPTAPGHPKTGIAN